MKIRHALLLWLLLPTFAGCIGDDYSRCPPRHNITLHFNLPDNADNKVFDREISAVDVIVYDAAGAHWLTRRVEQDELTAFRGVRLQLDPGSYSVVCWGNVLDNVRHEGVGTSNMPVVVYATIDTNGLANNSDRLYRSARIDTHEPNIVTRVMEIPAAHTITVPSDGQWQGTAIFTPAHYHVEVYVKGFNEQGNNQPNVRLTGLPASLGLFDGSHPSDTNTVEIHSATQPVTMQGQPYAAAHFVILRFEPDHPVVVDIISPFTGDIVYSFSLNEAIGEQHDSNMAMILRVNVEFKSTGVTISVPKWNSGDIGFGRGD